MADYGTKELGYSDFCAFAEESRSTLKSAKSAGWVACSVYDMSSNGFFSVVQGSKSLIGVESVKEGI